MGYDYEDFESLDPADLDCTWCGGDGYVFGDELGDPLFYSPGEAYACKACAGTGERKHQTLF